jgi:vacuolar-type H+-ATPase subunit I/STV1
MLKYLESQHSFGIMQVEDSPEDELEESAEVVRELNENMKEHSQQAADQRVDHQEIDSLEYYNEHPEELKRILARSSNNNELHAAIALRYLNDLIAHDRNSFSKVVPILELNKPDTWQRVKHLSRRIVPNYESHISAFRQLVSDISKKYIG